MTAIHVAYHDGAHRCYVTETGRDRRYVGCGHLSPRSAIEHSDRLATGLPATPRESSDLAPHEDSGSRNSSALAGLPVAEPPPGSFPVAATPATRPHKPVSAANPGAVSSPRGGSGDLPLQPGFGS